MKKTILLVCCAFSVLIFGCNSNADKKGGNGDSTQLAEKQSDSLMKEVMDGHNEGMAKYGKIRAMQAQLTSMLDSLAKLPAAAQKAAEPFKAGIDAALKDVNDAKNRMDAWMDTFNMDSAVNNVEARIKYLAEEKLKVGGIRDAILSSLAKADSLLTGSH